jgi:hypothetical protein
MPTQSLQQAGLVHNLLQEDERRHLLEHVSFPVCFGLLLVSRHRCSQQHGVPGVRPELEQAVVLVAVAAAQLPLTCGSESAQAAFPGQCHTGA